MSTEKGCRKEKNQNIQVFVRLRPLNQRERDIKSLGVVEVQNGREVVVRQSQQNMHTKRFTFDRAFPPLATQVEVYQEVVSPLIEEVLAGYNCTVFAYGQTGTGKTHTMVGEAVSDELTWQTDPLAGIIPRALSQLFDELRISNTEYTVRVSYLELYNEELFDLLSTTEDNSKLRIYEDVTRKGANIVNGLEEITVYNKNEVFKIMAQGQERKRVASTLMNAQSSRSHTVFTIVVHMKENSPEGEELVKIGKLNLVDLAGSENISKAGSDKRERARECVNINQSLLTLGRVITALVERHPHIPYRESKLTRILQESLGGRTKTSIIATVSPGHKDLEETMSTLEYANRAKNIQNKPEVNQKMTKKAILKEYSEEIDRLKRDLYAAREKNGVYLANETYVEITQKQEEYKKEIQELLLKKRAMEEDRDRMEGVFRELNGQLKEHRSQLDKTTDELSATKTALENTTNILNTTKLHFEEQKHLVSKQAATESALSAQARALLAAADAAAGDATKLQDSVDKRKCVESTNLEVTRTYREESSQRRGEVVTVADHFVASFTRSLGELQAALESYSADNMKSNNENKQKLDNLVQHSMDTLNKISSLKSTMQEETSKTTEHNFGQFQSTMCKTTENLENVLQKFSTYIIECLQKAGKVDLTADVTGFLQQWQQNASTNVTSLHNTHAAFGASVRTAACALLEAARRQQHDRHTTCRRLEHDMQREITRVKEEAENHKQYLNKEILEIDQEKEHFEAEFKKWAEEERRNLEERIQKRWTTEKSFLEDRVNRKLTVIEEQKMQCEKRILKQTEWLNEKLCVYQQEMEKAKEDFKEFESELNSCLNIFVEKSKLEYAAVTAHVECLSVDTASVVEKVKTNLVIDLEKAQTEIQAQSSSLAAESRQSMGRLAGEADGTLRAVAQLYQRSVDALAGTLGDITTTTIEDLTTVSNTVAQSASSCLAHENQQKLTLTTTYREIEQFYGRLREQVAQLEELETRCLNQEYAVYNPSGNTPVRTEYRYPRALAATSPHERILARFRAMRQNSCDDDCIVVENGEDPRSDTESSASEDSAAFAAPSPLVVTRNHRSSRHNHSASNLHATSNHNQSATNINQPAKNHNHSTPIVKCTSETDIYLKRRQQDQQGKENTTNSISRQASFKKPSQLPAPVSHKKPLYERNADN
ncbi:kinesin-like protein Klp61F [Bicyclus anynana]|uniref:Kinesin-like protein Klp61F n=1 Tax=Bicyclus anynana TaxID=110368 RepID=A0A6J1P8E7_BICAN|nr:kinesin-like protein Klp61F [Bicyclus anynana]